jgi:hypothetical protein
MSVNNNIQNALTQQLASVTSIPTIVYQNINYDPQATISYVRPTTLPAKSSLYGLDVIKEMGIYQVDIYTQVNKGTAPLLLLADSIRDKFISQRRLTSGTDVVFVQEVSISKAQQIEGWWSCFVEINYICFN